MSTGGLAPSAAEQTPELWPPASGPANLTTIEATPLSARGLPASTYELVTRAASLWAEQPAVSILPDTERWRSPLTLTFAELADQVRGAAGVLSALRVGRQDAVAVISPNCAELIPLLLAAEAVGIFAPINPALSPEHGEKLIRLSGARVIVAAGPELNAQVWERARALAQQTKARALLALRPTAAGSRPPTLTPLEGTLVAYLSEQVTARDGAGPAGPAPLPADVASYIHTGGTTGTPKLAARTHANEVANAWMIGCSDLLEPGSTMFAALPLFHTNALVVTVLEPLLKGQHVVWAGPAGYRDPQLFGVFWQLVERYRISAMSGVPTVYQQLLRVPVDADISSLRLPIVGAAPLPEAVRDAFEAHTGTMMCEGYGLTEATCASSRGWPQDPRPGTVGQRLPYQEVAAVRIDESTGAWTFLEAGEVGNIALRGPNVFAGYLRRRKGAGQTESGTAADARWLDTAGVIRHGWLDTGDLGSVDPDGFIHLAGRAKDLIIRGGHNIDPATIEEALLQHPAVSAAAAVGRPDQHSGEVPVAFVALVPGREISPDELLAWVSERIPEPAAAPKSVEVLGEIPLTSVGKQYKPELRRRAAEQAARTALVGTAAAEAVVADLIDGIVEVRVPHTTDDERVSSVLSAIAWTWRWA